MISGLHAVHFEIFQFSSFAFFSVVSLYLSVLMSMYTTKFVFSDDIAYLYNFVQSLKASQRDK